MTAEEIVNLIINDQLDPEEFTPETLLDDMGADSLDKIQLVLAFEEMLDINVPDAEVDKLKTVADIIALVKFYGKGKVTEASVGERSGESGGGKEVKGPIL